MLRRKILLVGSMLCLASTMAPAYAESTQVVQDMVGRKVTVPSQVDRIVALAGGALRQVVYMQAADKVVGVEDSERRYLKGAPSRPYMTANPQLAKLPRVGPGLSNRSKNKPDYEAILNVRPQVVFMTQMDSQLADQVQHTLNIPVVVLSAGKEAVTFDESVYDSFRLLGKVLNKQQRAKALVAYIQAAQADLQKRSQGVSKKSAYVGAVSYSGSHGINGSSLAYTPFDWAGVHNLVKGMGGGIGSHIKLDREALLRLNPKVIFVDGSGWKIVREDYNKQTPFYHTLRAYKTQNIYRLYPYVSYSVNIDLAILNAYAVGKTLYPHRYKDVNLAKKANAIFEFMLGKPIYQTIQKGYGSIAEKIVF